MPESIPPSGTNKAEVDLSFSSVLDWLTKIHVISDEELETMRQDAKIKFSKEQRKAFATAYSCNCPQKLDHVLR